jgi:antagonist of KipI
MGSCATYEAANIGGLHGKPLQKGDCIPCKGITQKGKAILQHLGTLPAHSSFVQTAWTATPGFYPISEESTPIRIIKGPEYALFSSKSKSDFWNGTYFVSPQSNRMGYRLEGPPLSLAAKTDILSSAVTFGTLLVPPEGKPIILMADHQTTGGYPRIGIVATADLCRLAQVLPGKAIHFKEISFREAEQVYIAQEHWIEKIRKALRLKLR